MSRSNPYYIVEQGKISQLMKQSKAARLSLFQDIAGTKVYDDRKRESQKIMKETDSKRAHIDDVISTLEDRLKELEAESKEFKQYQVRHNKGRERNKGLRTQRLIALCCVCARRSWTRLVAVWSTASTIMSERSRTRSSRRSIRREVSRRRRRGRIRDPLCSASEAHSILSLAVLCLLSRQQHSRREGGC